MVRWVVASQEAGVQIPKPPIQTAHWGLPDTRQGTRIHPPEEGKPLVKRTPPGLPSCGPSSWGSLYLYPTCSSLFDRGVKLRTLVLEGKQHESMIVLSRDPRIHYP